MKNKKLNEGIFLAAKKLTDAFFTGLKNNMTNTALEKVKQNKKVPIPIVAKMTEIDKAARELQKMIKELE